MRIRNFARGGVLGLWLCLIYSVSFCHGTGNTVEVIGVGECVDCGKSNIKSSQAFSGLRIIINCKTANGELKTRGIGELEKDGKFKISLPQDIVENGDLKEQCYAQLHSASSKPCPIHSSLEDSKIVSNSKTDEKQTFTTSGKLKFSPVTCTSAFFWPHFKYPPLPKLLPLPKLPPFPHPWKNLFPFPPKSFPPIYKKPLPPPVPKFKKPLPPPVPVFKKPLPPPVPILKKPLPPPVPVFKKPLPPPVPKVKKPLPPPVPKVKKPLPPQVPKVKKPLPPQVPKVKKPLPPRAPKCEKPFPPPVPKFKKPLPPTVPISKHKPPVSKPPSIPKFLPPPVPKFKKPLPPPISKPFPPFPKIPPVYKKPFPSIPKFPPFHKFPPKYFHHPKIGYIPPPYSPNP